MTLLDQTLLISGLMLALCALPLFFERIQSYSKFLFLTGTGALLGLVLFDLVPDVIDLGGRSSFIWIGIFWGAYSLLHLFHVHEHGESSRPSPRNETERGGSVAIFLFAMAAHCFSSGMLLTVSEDMSADLHRSVFLALLAHKMYEALTVSTVVAQKVRSRSRAFVLLLGYALSLPAGEAVTLLFRSQISSQAAWMITCVATGTLIGCLYSDFLLPSVSFLRKRRMDLAWIVGGLAATELMIRFV